MTQTSRGQNLKLPYSLQKELGLDGRPSKRDGARYASPVKNGREQRKAERIENRSGRKYDSLQLRRPINVQYNGRAGTSLPADKEGTQFTERSSQIRSATIAGSIKSQSRNPKSILKKKSAHLPSPPAASQGSSRESSPGLVLDASSRSFKDRLAEDDNEIAKLEKKLGIKNKKLSKASHDDGLDDILDGLDQRDEGSKRKRDGVDLLENKRRKVRVLSKDNFSDDEDDLENPGEPKESDIDSTDAEDASSAGDDWLLSEEENNVEEDDFADFDGEEEPSVRKPDRPTRENPYRPPIPPSATTTKYVPPSLRNIHGLDNQSSERLKRQIQGHLNKLSEANLVTILNELEKVYESNPRQEVTSVLIELLLASFCNPSALQNTFVILHAAFVAAVYKVIGTAFGAQILSSLVERFDEYYNADGQGKESLNLISFLANLFAFNVTSSTIVYDHIKLLLEELTERNAELLLRVIRDCGPQLRQDDPAALKTIVQMVQISAKRLSDHGHKMSVRTQFMVESLTDLKNNKIKTATNAAGLASEHITRMRKVLGSLNSRNIKGSDPLRISREDIQRSEKIGKWWLVGASWKGNEVAEEASNESPHSFAEQLEPDPNNEDVDLLTLSRQYQMNTEVRRSIFVAIMSAADYQDAHLRILKLRLKRSQEEEIPKVLLRCTGAESAYNPYYGLLAKKLCSEKKLRKTFEFAIWTFFKRIGQGPREADVDDSDDEIESRTQEPVNIHEIANLAKLYGFLISEGSLSLSVFKVLDLLYLKEQAQIFVELLFVTIFLSPVSSADLRQANNIPSIIERGATEAPQLIERLRYFIKKHVRKSDLVGKQDRDKLKSSCQVALQTLENLRI